MSLYVWLKFFHILGLALFLVAHGVSGGASFALRGSVSTETHQLLQLSQRSGIFAYPGLILVIVTGVWMGFLGSWWGRGWIWVSIVVLILLIAGMSLMARPYYRARDAAGQTDDMLAERLSHARPVAAAWIGSLGLLVLVALMIFKPF